MTLRVTRRRAERKRLRLPASCGQRPYDARSISITYVQETGPPVLAASYTQDIATYIRAQADWRSAKADEYPDDERNTQSAAALYSLADYIESGDADVLALAPHSFADGMMLGGDRVKAEILRYGFGYAIKSHLQHDEMLEEAGDRSHAGRLRTSGGRRRGRGCYLCSVAVRGARSRREGAARAARELLADACRFDQSEAEELLASYLHDGEVTT